MKLYIVLALALMAVSASAGFGVNVKQLIATKKGGVIDQDNLKYIIQSQYNQYTVITSFFAAGDIIKNGQLTQLEFAKAYSGFIYFLLGETPSAEVIAARWLVATWEQDQSDYVNLAGFTFLVTLDLRFLYDNYCLFDGNLAKLPAAVQKINSALTGSIETNELISAVFFGFDYNKDNTITPAEFRSGFRILGYILGLNITYTSALLNDLFAAADVTGDLKLSPVEVVTYVNAHLKDIQGLITVLAK